MPDIHVFPFNNTIGYPQKQQIQINNAAYTLYYRWNPEEGGFAILKIKRNVDNAVMYSSRLVQYIPAEIRDPITYALLFTIFPYLVTGTQCTVWVTIDG